MNTRAQTSIALVTGLIAVAVGVSACGTDDATPRSATATVTVESTNSVDTLSPVESGNAPASTADATAEVTDPAATNESAPANTAAPKQTPAPALVGRYPSDANVDANGFRGTGAGVTAYYFQSPSGNVRCGIHPDDPKLPSGCQATTSVSGASGITCRNDGGSQYSLQLLGDVVLRKCLNQPLFVGGSGYLGQGVVGGRVLQYGQIISTGGITCESTVSGMSCWSASAGFLLARQYNVYEGQGV
ncbi:hypothetical protein ACQ7HM_13470 [Williamsia sp. MIQD14]|uniref:hypothetical protein n=1 Tax=Williamsia sp. MIQD14 TaxID=3425703 RepID=UPI003DA01976